MTTHKLIAFIFILFGFISFSNSQELSFTSGLPEVRENFVGSFGNKMIYSVANQALMSSAVSLEYLVVNSSSPSEKKVKVKPQVKLSKGNVLYKKIQVQGNFIYEFYNILYYPAVESQGIAIVKRDLETMNQVGETVEILGEAHRFSKSDDEGFYLFSKNMLYRYDLDLTQLWSKKYEMFDDLNVKLNNIEIDDNLNMLMSISITENVKEKMFGYTPPAKSSLIFIITDLMGEVKVIAPEIPREMYVNQARFNYNDETKQLAGLFIVGGEEKGYVFAKWNIDGSILTTENHDFKFSEFLDDDLKKYASVYKIDLEKINFSGISSSASIRYLENGNILYIMHEIYTSSAELSNSRAILLISAKGELLWNRIIPYNSNRLYRGTDFYIHNDQLHFLINEFTESYSSGNYEAKSFNYPVNGKTVLLADRAIDLKTGDEISNKPLIANPSEKFIPTKVIYNQREKVIVRYSNTGKNLEQFLTIKF